MSRYAERTVFFIWLEIFDIFDMFCSRYGQRIVFLIGLEIFDIFDMFAPNTQTVLLTECDFKEPEAPLVNT